MWIALCIQTLAIAAWVLRPGDGWLWAALVAGCLAIAGARGRRQLLLFVMAAVLAVVWITFNSQRRDMRLLPDVLHDVTVDTRARVLATPRHDTDGVRFTAALADPTLPSRVSVYWPAVDRTAALAEGQCWRLRLRFSRLASGNNPGVFDYADWQRERGLGARAVVRSARGNMLCRTQRRGLFDGLRAAIRASVSGADISPAAGGVLLALMLGERQGIDDSTRALFAATGTSHLMAISGLHIGLMAGLGYVAGRRLPWPARWLPADRGTAVGALFAALYAALSGFAIPAQRALLMLMLVACIQRGRRRVDAPRLVALAALALFVIEPLVTVSAPFVFSFSAVAIIALLAWRSRVARSPPVGSRLRQAVYLQCALGCCLAPLTMGWFGYASAVSIPANLLVIPVFSLFVVPLAMLGCALSLVAPSVAAPLWALVAQLLDAVLLLLSVFASWHGGLFDVAQIGAPGVLLATLAVVFAVLTRGLAGGALALPVLLALALVRAIPPDFGCVGVTMLNVGHGTAMPIHTPRGWSIYDAGPAWRGGSDAAARILLPYLRAQGASQLQVAIISHDDNDHSGGVASLAQGMSVQRWLGAGKRDARPCRAGQRWVSGGVVFHVLWPLAGDHGAGTSDNNRSCVLRIGGRANALLITGDIEQAAELELVALGGLSARLVTVPHHGSATSSTAAFIDATAPGEGWISAASGGRWLLPHPQVRQRWQRAGVVLKLTGARGALLATLCMRP